MARLFLLGPACALLWPVRFDNCSHNTLADCVINVGTFESTESFICPALLLPRDERLDVSLQTAAAAAASTRHL